MLGFIKKLFHRESDLDLDLDLKDSSLEFSREQSQNVSATQSDFQRGISQSSFSQTQASLPTVYPREEGSFLNPQAFIPYQPPIQSEEPIKQQLEVLQSKIDMLNSKIDLLLQRIQMLEQYIYYRR